VVTVNALIGRVQGALTPDLLKPGPWTSNPRPFAGHCYAASEALFHLCGGRESGLTPMVIRHEGATHWFLRTWGTKEIIDPTAEQFETPVPYSKARGCGFLTARPSKRAQVIIDRVTDAIRAQEVTA
jgi:hypothetical protein